MNRADRPVVRHGRERPNSRVGACCRGLGSPRHITEHVGRGESGRKTSDGNRPHSATSFPVGSRPRTPASLGARDEGRRHRRAPRAPERALRAITRPKQHWPACGPDPQPSHNSRNTRVWPPVTVISHGSPDVVGIADRIVALSQGEQIMNVDAHEVSEAAAAVAMELRTTPR